MNNDKIGFWGLGAWGLGFKLWGFGFKVWGLGFRVWGLGFGVWDLGFSSGKNGNNHKDHNWGCPKIRGTFLGVPLKG